MGQIDYEEYELESMEDDRFLCSLGPHVVHALSIPCQWPGCSNASGHVNPPKKYDVAARAGGSPVFGRHAALKLDYILDGNNLDRRLHR
jgi:hypothetical protein